MHSSYQRQIEDAKNYSWTHSEPEPDRMCDIASLEILCTQDSVWFRDGWESLVGRCPHYLCDAHYQEFISMHAKNDYEILQRMRSIVGSDT